VLKIFYFCTVYDLIFFVQTRNPHAVQHHLQKCFDGIAKLEFEKDVPSDIITSVISPEGEKLVLAKVSRR
jgi:dynein heavy chain